MLTQHQAEELQNLLPGKVFSDEHIIQKHSGNTFYINKHYADRVVFVETEEDIVVIVNFCVKHKIPLIPYGSGTSVEGHIAAVKGGICVNLSKMNKIKKLSLDDGYVIVQPGIAYNKLNALLEPHGWHFPVEAGWGASIGGMVSTNASGAGAVDSGSMAKNVMGLSVIVYKDNQASKINIGTKATKTSVGYNLINLFVGSEGTLGVITEICLRIRKNLLHYKTICCQFDKIHDAVAFVIALKGMVQFRKVELLDKLQTEACVTYSKMNYLHPQKITVLIEIGGNELAINEQAQLIADCAHKMNVVMMKRFDDKQSAAPIWMMRKNACPAAIQFIDKNKKAMATDVCVPISKLNECINACYLHMQRIGIKAPLVAHVGDGNFHFTVLLDPDDPDDLAKALEFNKCVVQEALRVGGTCTGEHGVGLGKKIHLAEEHGDSLFLMQKIKQSFDPLGIFNPGKIFEMKETLQKMDYKQVADNPL